jgi:hypothetical protein
MLPLRRTRRLQDTLLSAAHRACDDGLFAVASKLLHLAEEVVAEEPDLRRRRQDRWALIAAHERLWHLRHGGLAADPAGPPPLGFAPAAE